VVWGLPYDVFLFTMLQEMLAVTLGLDLGVYVHVAGSLHLYERHVSLAKRVLAEAPPLTYPMPVMASLSGLNDFLAAERATRLNLPTPALEPYWSELADVLREFALSRSPVSEVALI
jgi:thymidylate synthase